MSASRVVIIGGGFLGVLAARFLRQKSSDVQITLVDPKPSFLFTPRLIDLLAGKSPRATHKDLKSLGEHVGFAYQPGQVEFIDRTNHSIRWKDEAGVAHTESYDYLVYAPGTKASFYGIPGAVEYSFPLKTVEDVKHIHAQALACLEAARVTNSDEERKQLLSFVIVGGGPTGIEALFALRRFVFASIKKDEHLVSLTSFTLIQGAPQILPGFRLSLVERVMRELHDKRIQLLLGEAVSEIAKNTVKTRSGKELSVGLVLWCAGAEANMIEIQPEPIKDKGGYIAVDQELRLDERVFIGGDVASYQEDGRVTPKNAQTAFLMARIIAENIVRGTRGLPLLPFHYVSNGNLLDLDTCGIVDLPWGFVCTRLGPWIRDLFYRFRYWQIVH